MASKLETITMIICMSMCCLSAMPVAFKCKRLNVIRSYVKVERQHLNLTKIGSAWKVIKPCMTLHSNSIYPTNFSMCKVNSGGQQGNRHDRLIRWFNGGTMYGPTSTGSSVVFKPVPDKDEIVFQVSYKKRTNNCRLRCTLKNTKTMHYLVDMDDGKGTAALAQVSQLDRRAWWCLG